MRKKVTERRGYGAEPATDTSAASAGVPQPQPQHTAVVVIVIHLPQLHHIHIHTACAPALHSSPCTAFSSLLSVVMSSQYKVPYLPTMKYRDELIATARTIATPGKGILAADESTGTIGVRLQEIKAENSRANRRAYRQLLFTTPGLSQHISGCILYEETLLDKTDDGADLVQPLRDAGIVLGIKVDLGTKHLPGTDDETYTQGLTDLDKRCDAYYKAGCRFAKWRAVLRISQSTPSPLAIKENADTLAKYAAICQAHGLVPIVEPEILMDGQHSLQVCQYWTEKVVSSCYRSLNEQHVLLEGTLLKPNMCLPGKQSGGKVSVDDCARATVEALQRTVPPAVPAVVVSSTSQPAAPHPPCRLNYSSLPSLTISASLCLLCCSSCLAVRVRRRRRWR